MSPTPSWLPPSTEHASSAMDAPISTVMAKSFKRRASKACSFCQWRKIRCNVEDQHPCSNCTLEKIECSITKTRKSKKSKHYHTVPESVPETEQIQAIVNTPETRSRYNVNHLASPPNEQLDIVNDPQPYLNHHEGGALPRHRPDKIIEVSRLSLTPSLSSAQSPQGLNKVTPNAQSPHVSLPDFIEPVPSHLPPEDIEYLHRKGCFEVPAPKFRDAIFCSYAEFVHPYMPLLDLGRFLHTVTSSGNGRVSLLLFQAIMFAGCAHVDIKPLRMLGFLTRKAARKAWYLKTKALYDIDYEQNRICVIQVLALMAYWYETPDDQKNACHWLQIAVALGRRAGLDRNPEHMDIDLTEQRMRRRIWWSCLNRDPLCALGLKAPLCCSSSDHDVPDPTVDDFDLGDVPREGFDKVGVRWPPGKRRLLCLASTAQTGLHRQLGRIVSKQYRLTKHRRANGISDANSSTMVLLPSLTEEARLNLKSIDEDLKTWRRTLPTDLQSTAVGSEISDSGFEPFVVFRTVLHMLYHTCILTLYRPWLQSSQLFYPSVDVLDQDSFQSEVQRTIREAAHSITDLALELHQLDLVRHLPQTGLSALGAAIISHISDTLSSSQDLRESGRRGFERCSHLLNELRENYYSADFLADFVKILAQSKRLPQKSNTGDTGLDFLGGILDVGDTDSAFAQVDPGSLGWERPVVRPLPEALFPEGTDLSTNTGGVSENRWDLALNLDLLGEENHPLMSLDLIDDWDYYSNVGIG